MREILFFLDRTERGKSNDIAHGSIIEVSTVVKLMDCINSDLVYDNKTMCY